MSHFNIKFMKTYIHYLLISIVVFLISSCASKDLPSDPLDYFKSPTVVLEPSAIITLNTPILQGSEMQLLYDSIAAIKMSKVEKCLALVNINTGEVMRELITQGQGPGEVIAIFFCPQPDKNKLLIYEPNLRTVFNIDCNKAITDDKYMMEPIVKFEYRALSFLPVDTFFVASGLRTVDNRFQIYDSKGELITSCLNYDKADMYSHVPDRVYSTGFQGIHAIHPSGEKFVFAASLSGSFQIFNFTPNEITLHKDLTFNNPVITCDENVCAVSLKAIAPADAIASGDKYFYVLYSGNTLEEYVNKFASNNLLVFDWDGNPVKRYVLQQPITTFAINSTGDKLYGIADMYDVANMPEGIAIVQYDLE